MQLISPQDVTQQHESLSLTNALDKVSKGEPAIDALPLEAHTNALVENRSEDLSTRDQFEDETKLEERGRVRTGGSNGKRSLFKRTIELIFG